MARGGADSKRHRQGGGKRESRPFVQSTQTKTDVLPHAHEGITRDRAARFLNSRVVVCFAIDSFAYSCTLFRDADSPLPSL